MTRVLLDLALRLGFEGTAFLPHQRCFTKSTSGLLEPYLFSGSSSSSAAHEGPDWSSSPTKTKNLEIEWFHLAITYLINLADEQ